MGVEVPAPAPTPAPPGACCRRPPLAVGARAPLVERCNVSCEQGVRWQMFCGIRWIAYLFLSKIAQ